VLVLTVEVVIAVVILAVDIAEVSLLPEIVAAVVVVVVVVVVV
jgi:hypothetical protein